MARATSHGRAAAPARKILLYRLGSLGDTLVALPCFHLVRDTYPDARITLLTNIPINAKAAPAAAILEGTGLVDAYLAYPTSLRAPGALFRLRQRLAAERFDLLIYMAKPRGRVGLSARDALFFWTCGITRQLGVPFQAAALRCQPIPGTGRFQPESHRLMANLARLGAPDLADDRLWSLHLNDSERAEASRLLAQLPPDAPFLALSMGTKADAKDWTEANWSALVDQIGTLDPRLALVGLGSADESERTERILRRWHGPGLNLCGTIGPRVSAAVLERSVAFVGHDSGPMHLAAAVGTPCVAIFSAQNRPGEWFPRGRKHRVLYHQTECFGCGLSVCVTEGKRCILSITVPEVLNALGEVLRAETATLGADGNGWTRPPGRIVEAGGGAIGDA